MTWRIGLVVAAAASIATGFQDEVLTIEVIDEAGHVVDDAEAYLIEAANDLPATKGWVKAEDGRVVINTDDLGRYVDGVLDGSASAVVRAPGYAWAMAAIPTTGPMQMTLPKGRDIEFVLEGATIPEDLTPFIFARGQSVAAWIANVQSHETRAEKPTTAFSATVARRIGDGRYSIRVAPDVEEFWILIDHPGFLRALQLGPIDPTDDDMRFELPAPVKLVIDVAPEEGAPAAYESCGAWVTTSPDIPDGGWSFRMAKRFVDGKSLSWTLDDLSPASYGVDAYTGTSDTWNDQARDDYFQARVWVDITTDPEATTKLALKTYDEAAVRAAIAEAPGTTVQFLNAGGEAPEGMEYKFTLRVTGFNNAVTLAEGQIASDGRVTLDHVPGYRAAASRSRSAASGPAASSPERTR